MAEAKTVEVKPSAKKVSKLNKDGFVKGAILTPSEYAKYQAKYK